MLKELSGMSRIAGARVDYVQGGGGNTSVKLEGGLMAIKASGYRLRQVTETEGFAIVETDTLKNVTEEQGYKALRPSVEVGLHALMGKFVLHTHPVYANLALCSVGGADKLPALMEGISFVTVPYINPGEELCAAVKERLRPDTQVVFMVNHGIVVSAETADECIKIHDEVNERIAKAYGVSQADFERFMPNILKTLYPDQQVYLELSEVQKEILAACMFIQFTLLSKGEQPQSMDEKAMDFIANWESEAYRKSVMKQEGR